jgi:glycosyltransferase involved in cell wall biosynthesis
VESDGRPLLSVISPSLHHGRFLEATIASIEHQTYRNFEYIVVDGGSVDTTLPILAKHPWIRWISEPDDNVFDAYRKAIDMCRGEFIVQCCISDGFLDRSWFDRCVAILNTDSEVSAVWGLPRYMSEDNVLGPISYKRFLNRSAPQKQSFFPFWLATSFVLPEGNYCMRRSVLDTCFPRQGEHRWPGEASPHLECLYKFHTQGFLTWFLPVVANFGRIHRGQRNQQLASVVRRDAERYSSYVRRYRSKLLAGLEEHAFVDGSGHIIGAVTHEQLQAYRVTVARIRAELLVRSLFTRVFHRITAAGQRLVDCRTRPRCLDPIDGT